MAYGLCLNMFMLLCYVTGSRDKPPTFSPVPRQLVVPVAPVLSPEIKGHLELRNVDFSDLADMARSYSDVVIIIIQLVNAYEWLTCINMMTGSWFIHLFYPFGYV